MGSRGGYGTVRRYLCSFAPGAAPPATPAPPKVRDVATRMLRHPDDLGADEQVELKDVRARCSHLDALARHVASFAEMMAGLHGDRLDAWIAEVEAADDPVGLRPFARGLMRDHAAVANGLTLAHSSGAVEGSVNRTKMLKRQTYGRADFALLRKRVLPAA